MKLIIFIFIILVLIIFLYFKNYSQKNKILKKVNWDREYKNFGKLIILGKTKVYKNFNN